MSMIERCPRVATGNTSAFQSLAEKIYKLAAELNVSILELSSDAGFKYNVIGKYLCGQLPPNSSLVKEISGFVDSYYDSFDHDTCDEYFFPVHNCTDHESTFEDNITGGKPVEKSIADEIFAKKYS